jgi:hypothetical protein
MPKTKAVGTLNPGICDDWFEGSTNDVVNFKHLPASCTLTQLSPPASNPFPFSPSALNGNGLLFLKLPLPVPSDKVTIAVGAGDYQFTVSCCPGPLEATHTVHVEDNVAVKGHGYKQSR